MATTDLSIAQYIASAERNLRSSLMPPGYFAKQTYLQVSDVFTATYGRKVWDALNNQTRFWNILRKVQWGPTTGWRVRSDRGSNRSRPVTETGSLPTVDVSAYQNVDSAPRIMATDFGVSLKSQIMSGLEGGMGDNLAVEQEAAARDHIKELNQELLLRAEGIVTTGGASATAAVLGAGNTFRIGDTISDTGLSDASKVISGISGNVLTYTGGGNLTDGAVAYVKARAGLTSLDDIVNQDGVVKAAVTLSTGADVYNQTTRTAGTYNAAATVLHNSGTARNLTLSLLDQAIREVRVNGADPDVILMGYDQFDRLSSLLQAQQRYMDWGEFVVKVGDESTLPGSHAGFQVATYRGIPVIVDPDVQTSFTAADAEMGSNVYVIDTRYLELAVAAPTQYIDNRDFFQANAFVLRGLFYTIGELRALRMDAHSKITDLNA
ncbi:putative major capsid protein [uncultured virus]|uniref:Putative major capsid protein n=1 Tax=uncultured virus TaxID=340016 RepID=A0A218MKW7_9VIRU|nr:putative major capsid protein [uncultured virus]